MSALDFSGFSRSPLARYQSCNAKVACCICDNESRFELKALTMDGQIISIYVMTNIKKHQHSRNGRFIQQEQERTKDPCGTPERQETVNETFWSTDTNIVQSDRYDWSRSFAVLMTSKSDSSLPKISCEIVSKEAKISNLTSTPGPLITTMSCKSSMTHSRAVSVLLFLT